MTLYRVRRGNLHTAGELLLHENSSFRRSISSQTSSWPWKKVPRRFTRTSRIPSGSGHLQKPEKLPRYKRVLVETPFKHGGDGPIEKSLASIIASIPVRSHSAVREEKHESTLRSKTASVTAPEASEGFLNRNEAVPIKKYETREDESFYEQVHIKPFNPYPAYWLRDNCQCSSCIRPDTRQRMVSSFELQRKIYARSIYEKPPGNMVVKWSDGHLGEYPTSWLESHQLPETSQLSQKVLTFRKFKHRHAGDHPSVEFDEVMSTNDGLTTWLQYIVDWGYCLVKGVPVTPEATKTLLERIAFIRETHYGGFWDFTSDLTFKDTAYTDEALDAHTDNTYFSDPARLQLFHLLEHTQGEGGKTLLVDGFDAAWRMLLEDPINVEAFTDFPQPWHSSGNEHVSIQPYRYFPVLERDPESARLLRVRWNNYDRAAKIDWTPRMAMQWYRAARYWNAIIHREQLQKWLQLTPGTALLFDNWRMLHGRSKFTGRRRLCGGYINNDDFLSRFRLLKSGREEVLNDIGAYKTRLSP